MELLVGRAGTKMLEEDTITTECTPSVSRAREKAKVKKIVRTAVRQDTFPKSVPTHRRARAKTKEAFKENAKIVVRWGIPYGSARKTKEAANPRRHEAGAKGKETSKEMAKEEFGKLMETTPKDTLSGVIQQRRSRAWR